MKWFYSNGSIQKGIKQTVLKKGLKQTGLKTNCVSIEQCMPLFQLPLSLPSHLSVKLSFLLWKY